MVWQDMINMADDAPFISVGVEVSLSALLQLTEACDA